MNKFAFRIRENRAVFDIKKTMPVIACLDKTVMAVGSDTLKGTREVYAAVKQHKDKVPGLSAVYDEMSAFFK